MNLYELEYGRSFKGDNYNDDDISFVDAFIEKLML